MTDLVLSEISPAELLMDVLTRLSEPDIAPAGVVVGPTNDAQQQAGVITIMDAGMPVVELYTPVIWVRPQLRCLAGTLSDADRLARAVQRNLHDRGRIVARMASTDQRYLIHRINVDSGPSMHYDSPETWETLVFASVMLGTEPL